MAYSDELFHLSQWEQAERKYSDTGYEGEGTQDAVEHVSRDSSLLLVAPHSLNHFRNGKTKLADRFTGTICSVLGDEVNASTLIAVGPISSWEDWTQREDDFKTALDAALVDCGLLLDIHGMSNKHEIDVCVGTGPNPSPNVTRLAENAFDAMRGFRVVVGHPFNAAAPHTVTSYAQTTGGVDALQVEISASLRTCVDGARTEAFMTALGAWIRG